MSIDTSEPQSQSATPPKGRGRVTLVDIARELSVSPSLVSKVLNRRLGGSGASKEMIEAIFEKAHELDYQAHTVASALSNRRVNAIAVLVHEHGVRGSELATAAIQAIAGCAARQQQRLVLQYYQTEQEFESLLPIAHQSAVDGVILLGLTPRSATSLNRIVSRQLPVATVLDEPIRSEFVNITMDQAEVGRIATEHLLAAGCRQLAFLGTARAAVGRAQGFESALAAAGLKSNPALIMKSDPALIMKTFGWTAQAAEQTVRDWLDQGLKFDGIVAISDQLAAGAINVLLEKGIKVPQQVKITGIDNSPYCEFFTVPITSVSQQMGPRAEMAFEALMRCIDDQPVQDETVAPVLHVRRSSQVVTSAAT